MQALLTQMRPVPQLLSPVQGPQVWVAVQTWPPVVHSPLSWQVPITHEPEAQM